MEKRKTEKKWKRTAAAMIAAACMCSGTVTPYAAYAQDISERGAAGHSMDAGQDTSGDPGDAMEQKAGARDETLQPETGTVQRTEDSVMAGETGKNEGMENASEADGDRKTEDTDGLVTELDGENTGSLEAKEDEDAEKQENGAEKESSDRSGKEPEANVDMTEDDNADASKTGTDESNAGLSETGTDEENVEMPDEAGGEDAEGEYTDVGGVVYKYRTDGGEADIYEISGFDGKDVSIPVEIDGCPVKRLTLSMRGASVSSLTVPESASQIRAGAFSEMKIGELFYNAVDAADMENAWSGPFGGAEIGLFTLGAGVKSIPAGMFSHTSFLQESFVLDVPYVRDSAFRYAVFKGLTVGEGVSFIGQHAFADSNMEKLDYNAADAEAEQTEYATDAMLYNAEIGELAVGSSVKKLPYGFMCYAKLKQDVLEIPDSVQSIEDYVFFAGMDSGNIAIGDLTIGKNASRLGNYIFGNCKFDRCVIKLLKAPKSMTSFLFTQPECGSVEAHRLGVYFDYFTAKTEKENITILCSDFDISYLPEFYNEEKGAFSRRVDTKCKECGHLESEWEYSKAVIAVFADHDGTELSRQVLHPGEDAQAPEKDPEREGHVFTGWDKDFTNVMEDLVITARYESNQYTVTFKNGDDVAGSQKVPYGSAAKAPEDPKREGYVFTGWDKDFSNVTGDLTVTAQFKAESYTVVFFDGTEELDRQKVEYGAAASAPQAPEHEGRQFTGWDKDFSRVTKEMAVFAQYESVYFTVTFMDGTKELGRQEVAYGEDASAPKDPEKKGYIFTGWDAEFTNVTKDLTVTAQYRKNQYMVIFKDGGKELFRQEVSYGENASAPKAPEKKGYVFTGWDTEFTNVTKDLTVTAQYRKNQYMVIFKDGEKELGRQEVAYGEDAEAPKTLEKKGYTFTGWDVDFTNVTKDLTVTAQFKINRYLVRFWNGEKLLSSQRIEHGEAAKAPENPKDKSDGAYTYIFTGWDYRFESITGDMEIHAVFEKKKLQQKPGSNGGTEKPESDGSLEKPGSSGNIEKPDNNSGLKKPGGNGGTKKPDSNGSSENPVSNGGTEKPDSNENTIKTDSSGNMEKPVGGGDTKKTDSSTVTEINGKARPDGEKPETGQVQKTGTMETQAGAARKNTDGNHAQDRLPKQHSSGKDNGEEKIQKSESVDKIQENETGPDTTMTDTDADTDVDRKDNYSMDLRAGRVWYIVIAVAALPAVILLFVWLLFRTRKAGICGTVCGRDGIPLDGVEVSLLDTRGNRCRTAATDENGFFHFRSRRNE